MITELTRVPIHGIAAGGDGVGRSGKVVVFVPRTAPGDVALVRLAMSKRFARGELASLESAAPERIEPTCQHYMRDKCGGCQIQHLSYDAQLAAKSAIVGDAFRRIGRRDAGIVTVEPSDAQWEYRRKLTLHLRRSGQGWIAGLHPYDDPARVFNLVECPITERRTLAVWTELRSAFDLLPGVNALRMSVRALSAGAAVVVEGGDAWPDAEAFFGATPNVVELWWRPDHGRARRLASRTLQSQGGASFVQVNAGVAARVKQHVITRVRSFAPRRVIDAYAGSGDTALSISASGSTVVAIELDAEAVARFEGHLRAPSRAVAGRVEDHLQAALPADVVILNPPRSGVDERVTSALQNAHIAPRAIIYVSCDPATLARDLSRMPRYRLSTVRAYDMFPQTAHVETVCELVPEAA